MRFIGVMLIVALLGLGILLPAVRVDAATPTPNPTATFAICKVCGEEELTPTPRPGSVVHFWFFFDSRCYGCRLVYNNVLPHILAQYQSGQVAMHAWDVSQFGDAVQRAMEQRYGITKGDATEVFIGEHALLGSHNIETELPRMIDYYLAQGGVDLVQSNAPSRFQATPQPVPFQTPTAAPRAVVRAVLFFSPYCGHCEQVITKDLPPLFDKYGTRLQIIGINVAQPDGVTLYKAAAERFHIQEIAVPTLIVGDVVLIGSLDIPQQFPGLIEKYLAQGGVDLPAIPGLAEVMAVAQPAPNVTPHSSTQIPTASTPPVVPQPTASTSVLILPEHGTPDLVDQLKRDPVGNTLAIITLLGMLLVVANTFRIWFGAPVSENQNFLGREWLVPMLALIGLGIAAYLAYVETAQVTAVCGPVGDCNTVQQSEYARLFGVIPIGGLGVMGYFAILIAWLIARFSPGRWADLAGWLLWIFALFGTLFSIYLTFLEPFVIGAVCAWCLTSAIIMTTLLWLMRTAPHYFRQTR